MDIKICSRPHSISPRISFRPRIQCLEHHLCSDSSFLDAHRDHRGNYSFLPRAFRAADRRHHAGEILFRRSALRAGGAADARARDAAADAQPDASAAGQAVHRAVDPHLRRRAAGLALSGACCSARLRSSRCISAASRCSRRRGRRSRRPARLFQPDAVRAVADRDAGYFRAHLQPVRDRGVHARLPQGSGRISGSRSPGSASVSRSPANGADCSRSRSASSSSP